MKTKEELSALKAEFEIVKSKLAELSEEELAEVVGGGARACKGNATKNVLYTEQVGFIPVGGCLHKADSDSSVQPKTSFGIQYQVLNSDKES